MTDPIQRIKEEMNKRGLMRKLAVCVNGNPPPRLICPRLM